MMIDAANVHILYIEDNPLLCEMFKAALKPHGYSVDVALNGEDGEALFGEKNHDVVVLDHQLPDTTGIDIARRMLSDDPDLPILLVTGKGYDGLVTEALSLGISNYVTKDDAQVYLELIPSIIIQLLDKAKTRREKVEAETALRESRDRFQIYAEASSDWFWETDENLKFCFGSDYIRQIMGYEFDELVGLTREELLHPDFEDIKSEKWRDHLAKLEKRESFSNFEYRMKTKSGGVIVVSVSGKPYFGADGKFEGYRGVGSDISDRIALNDALAESEDRFRDFAEIGADWLWELDDQLRYIFISKPISKSDRNASDYIGRSIEEILLDKNKSPETDKEYQLRKQRLPYFGIEKRSVINPDEWVNASAKPIFDTKNNFKGYRGVAVDITKRVKAEAVIRESEIKSRVLSEIGTDWFWKTDATHQLVSHDRYSEIPGLPKGGVKGTSRWENASKQDQMDTEKWASHKAQLNAHKSFRDFEFELDSNPREWIRVSGVPIFDEVGTFQGYQGVSTIITERKQLEEKLRHSKRMEAVGQLTGGIAHDFNNLLGVMIGNAEMLRHKEKNNDASHLYIEQIIKAVDRASSLTGRLLAFSRRQILSPVPSDVTASIDGLGELLRRTLGETIDFKFSHTPELWSAKIDPHQFENALVNLALNARDAMPEGGILTVETANVTFYETYSEQHEEIASGDYVEVAVTDTGIGMTPEVLEKVFEPFFTTKEVGQGSGLGLSMVFGFAKQSGGHVTVSSEEGEGTTVKLFMPRSAEDVVKEIASGEINIPTTGSERILVVEDDENVRNISVSILSEQGYDVIDVVDGNEAIEHLKSGTIFDLLFTDVVLPGGMNGVEIAKQAGEIQPNIKVIFTTGYTESSITHGGKLNQGISLLNKPYRRAQLLEKVRTVLDRKPVLLIEDDMSLRLLLETGLKSAGFEVTASVGSDEGLVLLKSNPFDVIVSDIVMPDGEGIELLLWVSENIPDTPIIMMSGHSIYLEGSEKFGAAAILAKPFRTEELVNLIRKVTIGDDGDK